jgi:hypothetical protein
MNRFDWFFGQYVSQAEMDEAFWWAELADHAISADAGLVGIQEAMVVSQHSPAPDMTVDISGPGVATDRTGQRCYCADAVTNLDCSVDEYGVATAVTVPGEERYLGIFVRFNREYTLPMVDRNGVTVYTHQTEGLQFFVRQGTPAGTGTASKVALLSNALLLMDVLVPFGATQILDGLPPGGNMEIERREDWVRATFGVTYAISSFAAGTPGAGVAALLAYLNEHVSDLGLFHEGDVIEFLATGAWADASEIVATDVSAAINEIVADLAAFAGAARVGSAAYTTAGGYCDLADGDIQAALVDIADAVDGHIGGGAPAHPASAVTFSAHSWIAASDVQAAVEEIVDDLALQTGTVSGSRRIGLEAISATPDSLAAATLYGAFYNLLALVNDRERKDDDELCFGARFYDSWVAPRALIGGMQPPDPDGDYGWIANETKAWNYQDRFQQGHTDSVLNLRYMGAAADEIVDICLLGHRMPTASAVMPRICAVGNNAGTALAWTWDALLAEDHPTVTEYAISDGGAGVPVACAAYAGQLLVVYDSGKVILWNDELDADVWTTTLSGTPTMAPEVDCAVIVNGVTNRVFLTCGGEAAAAGASYAVFCLNLTTGAEVWNGDMGATTGLKPDGGLCTDGVFVFASFWDPSGTLPSEIAAGAVATGATAGGLMPYALPVTAGREYRCHSLASDGKLLWYPHATTTAADGAFCGIGMVDCSAFDDDHIGLGDADADNENAIMIDSDSVNMWFHLSRDGTNSNLLLPMRICNLPWDSALTPVVPNPYARAVVDEPSVALPWRMCYDGNRIWAIKRRGSPQVISVPYAANRG